MDRVLPTAQPEVAGEHGVDLGVQIVSEDARARTRRRLPIYSRVRESALLEQACRKTAQANVQILLEGDRMQGNG